MPSSRYTILALALAVGLGAVSPAPTASWLVRPVLAEEPAAELQQLLTENETLEALPAFKDSAAMLRAKLANLATINESRQEAGLPPLKLDLLASRVGNRHCADMVGKRFIGHWGSNGQKPYQRYSFAGGRDHVSENVYAYWMDEGGSIDSSIANVQHLMDEGHKDFMSERPPNDGHRQAVLTRYHTHVGLGAAVGKGYFAYCQEFIDHYVALDQVPTNVEAGATVVFKGRTVSAEFGPLALIVYYEPLPQPLPDPKQQPGSYGDFTDSEFATISPWQMKYNATSRSFQVPLTMRDAQPGSYYCMLYVQQNPATIPYKGGGGWDTNRAVPAAGVVLVVN